DAEPAFEESEILIVAAENRRSQPVVVERQSEFRWSGVGIGRTDHATSIRRAAGWAGVPNRLFVPVEAIFTGMMSPMATSPASICTGCKYGERPAIWPSWRPLRSNSTSSVRPTQARLNAW